MTAQTRLIDISTRHAVFIQRYGGGQHKEVEKLLTRLRGEIVIRLNDEPTLFRRDRLTDLLNDIDYLLNKNFEEIKQTIVSQLGPFAGSEGEFSKSMIESVTKPSVSFNLPSSEQLLVAVLNVPMDAPLAGSVITVDEALADFGVKKSREIKQLVNDSILLGDTTPEVTRKVKELITFRQNRQAEALVRTIINHASAVARDELYSANRDIVSAYEWVATLDISTTLTCASRDGKVFEHGGPKPPAHWNCRSTTIPVINSAFTLAKLKGQRPARGDKTQRINASTNYGTWLKKQSADFQNEALGAERAKLFRSGKLKIEQFVDPTGEVYTLDDLRAKFPLVFQ